METAIGTVLRTGERCPKTGLWKVQDCVSVTLLINEGDRMPIFKGKNVDWVFQDYVNI